MPRRTIDKVDTKRHGKKRRDWKPEFLKQFRETANVRLACERAGISRTIAYETRDKDADFAAAWDAAEQDAVDVLESRAWKRSRESDQLLMFLLRAHRPQKYQERTRNENVTLDLSELNDKQLELLAAGANLATVLASAGASGTGTPPGAGPAR